MSRKIKDTFNLLDHDHIEGWVQVRYLLNNVFQSVKKSDDLWGEFWNCLRDLHAKNNFDYFEICDDDNIMNCPLTQHNIPILMELLSTVQYKWKALGTALKLHDVDQYEEQVPNNYNSLKSVLCAWIKKKDNFPTLSLLQTVLALDSLSKRNLARDLESRLKQLRQLKCFSPQVKPSKHNMGILCSSDTEITDGKYSILGILCSHTEQVTYQWEKNGQALNNGPSYSGVNDSVLVILRTIPEIEGKYRCIVTQSEKDLVSNEVNVSIIYSSLKKHILQCYNESKEIAVSSRLTDTQKKFINVNLQDSNRNKVEYHKIFGDYEEGKLLFFSGIPGSGKTTLMKKLIKDWACGEALKDAKLVFYIPLSKCKSTNYSTFHHLLGCCIEHRAEEIQKTVREIEECDGKGYCFILDEMNDFCCDGSSYIYKLINKFYLPFAEVIVSSLPENLPTVQCKIYKDLEIIGFDKGSLIEFIDSHFGEGDEELKNYFDSLEMIPPMYLIPLNLCHICYIHKTSGGEIDLPESQTILYQKLIFLMVKHHLERHGKKKNLCSFDDLKQFSSFNSITKLAFNMLNTKTKNVTLAHLKEWDIKSTEDDLIDLWSLEMIKVNEELMTGKTLSFLYPSVRNFLAAYYILNLSKREKLDEFKEENRRQVDYLKNKSSINYSSVIPTTVWIFYCGLETFDFDGDFDRFKDIIIFFTLKNKIRFICETSQTKVVDQIMDTFQNEIPLFSIIEEKVYKMFNWVTTDTKQTDIRVSFDSSKKLDLCSKVTSNKIFQEIVTLYTTKYFDPKEILEFCSKLNHCSLLEILEIHLININSDKSNLIATQLKSLTSLKQMTLHCKPGTGDGIPQLLHGLQGLHVVMRLEFEQLNTNALKAVSTIFKSLHGPQISVLQLSGCEFNMDISESFASGVSQLLHLKTLNLSHNKIGNEITQIAKALEHLQNLETLDLSNNKINPSGAKDLSSAFEHLKKLKYLNLSRNNIGTCGARNLVTKIPFLISLISIDILDNDINVLAANEIQKELQSNKNLEVAKLGLQQTFPTKTENAPNNIVEFNEDGEEANAEPNSCIRYIRIIICIIICIMFIVANTWENYVYHR